MISISASSTEKESEATKLVVLQPGYLPWLGFFDQMRRSDVFVYYDDVQFDKHGWRNRNRIKSPHGPCWLTVPVRHSGLGKPRINEVEVDGRTPWGRKHIGTVRQYYRGAPYLDRYLPELEEVLMRKWESLIDLDLAVVDLLCRWLNLRPQLHRSSELQIAGGKTERLVEISRRFGARRYLSGSSARDYLDVDLFGRHGISVEWHDYRHPTYPQQHGDFVSHLSALDLILNCGDRSPSILAGGYE
jgi:hypothetical protein